MSNNLVEIPKDEWAKLRDLYLVGWPTNIVGYYTIDNYVKWHEKDINMKHINVYSLNGDWSDGTFLIVDRWFLMLNTLEESCTQLKKALSILDWSRGYFIATIPKRLLSPVIEVLKSKNLIIEDDDSCITSMYYIPRSKAAEITLTVPEGIVLKPVEEKDVAKADSVWPNQSNGTLSLLKRLAALNPSIGAYNTEGKLLAWTFRLQTGALVALQVDDEYKRRGLGSLVLRAISKHLALLDMDTFAGVNKKNFPSMGMFEKNGFTHTDDIYWLFTYPETRFEWTSDD